MQKRHELKLLSSCALVIVASLGSALTIGCSSLSFPALPMLHPADATDSAETRAEAETVASTPPPSVAAVSEVKAHFERGARHHAAGEIAAAVHWYRLAAAGGHTTSQARLGLIYSRGEGVPEDYARAVKWLRMAGAGNDTAALVELALMTNRGDGVPKDPAEAAALFEKAARRGNADAQANLGLMYARGEGVPQSNSEAVFWLRRAALQQHPGGQFNLAVMLDLGRGAAQNPDEAARLYRLSAQRHEGKGMSLPLFAATSRLRGDSATARGSRQFNRSFGKEHRHEIQSNNGLVQVSLGRNRRGAVRDFKPGAVSL